MKKMTITVKIPKPRNYNHFMSQVNGLMRTKVIKNKKKEVKKFNLRKESSYYLNILLNLKSLDNKMVLN